jgi:uncharacterized protein
MEPVTRPADTGALVRRLARQLHAQLVETHISWVLLLPDCAYKVKKPVRLPFLDYGTLERRRHFCEEEVRLNRRFAPTLYLGVSRLTGTPEAPAFDGQGPTLDYAVRMRRFPDEALFSVRADAGTLSPQDMDQAAATLAELHAGAPAVTEPAPATLGERSASALAGCSGLFAPADRDALARCIAQQASEVHPLWQLRRATGHARDCHGDLHLANLLELDGAVAAFDCIEFDPALRRIDVMEDAAFPVMDLVAHARPALAWRFLNAWLERTGEYEGLPGLRLCLVYRALVRACAHQLQAPGSAAARRYAAQALGFSRSAAPHLFITHGLPGSGKTYASQRLVEATGAIRLRSDVERKRLHGLDALADSRARGQAIYTPDATQRTYARLSTLARVALQAGWPVVLDAAFLRRSERMQAHALARSLGVPFSIVDCEASLDVLRQRLRMRRGDASEADEAVLEQLRSNAEPLAPEEQLLVVNAP